MPKHFPTALADVNHLKTENDNGCTRRICRLHLGQRRIFNRIAAERTRQDAKWGEQNHSDYMWLTILAEEVGEAAQACLRYHDLNEPKAGDDASIEAELVGLTLIALGLALHFWQ